ncbi:MAG: M48 family metallopeptidase [Rubellimicrobium sp.]|nr:M48 family metallopeptidase [Rubellimicrobium sp.]
MDEHVIPGDPPVRVALRRSARARRMSLRVSRLDGRVTLTLPPRMTLARAVEFAESRAEWLRGHLAQVGGAETPVLGGTIPFEGGRIAVLAGRVRGAVLRDGALILPDDPERVAPRVAAFLRAQARDRLAMACDRHAAALGRGFRSLTLRDTRSRWGSCSVKGDLMFSWRLIMAPPGVLDYVAAHEVAHLERMDHSPAFWEVVAQLCPGHGAQRRWLREQGESLHRLRLDP